MSGELSRHTNHHNETWTVMKKVYGPNERPVPCVCNPETGEVCMLHWDMDAWLIAFALADGENPPIDEDDDDRTAGV